MRASQLYQLMIKAEKTIAAQCAALLENSEPTPLAVSHFEEDEQQNKWCCSAFYNEPQNIAAMTDHIIAGLEVPASAIQVTCEDVPDINWVSHVQSNLKPIVVGDFFIHGSHDRDKANDVRQQSNTHPPKKHPIEIDAQEAFGTAHHGTTQGCLTALSQLAQSTPPNTILDLGTGTGILAIAAAKLWPNAATLATDNDPKAVAIAKENAAINQTPKIEFLCTEGCSTDITDQTPHHDLIIANILAKPLMTMASEISAALAPNATLILSGILNDQASDVIAAYQTPTLKLTDHKQIEEWSTLVFKK